MLRLAELRNDSANLLWAHYAIGIVLSDRGENKAASEQLELCIALYDRTRAGHYGYIQDPGPTALLLSAIVLHRLGSLDVALKRTKDGLALARELAHPYTLAWVLGYGAERYMDVGDDENASGLWEEQAALSTRYGFPELLEDATIGRG